MKRSSHILSAQSNQHGFTLVELMITLALAAILAGIVAPNLRDFVLNSRLTSTAGELVRSLQFARSEAIKRQRNIVVCMSANPTATTPTCSTSGINSWMVFEDTDNDWDHDSGEAIIATHTFESSKITVSGNVGIRLSFASTGFTNPNNAGSTLTPTTAVVMCDGRGNTGPASQSTARGVVIAPATGRPNVTRVKTQIQALAITGINTLCPP